MGVKVRKLVLCYLIRQLAAKLGGYPKYLTFSLPGIYNYPIMQ